MRCPIHGDRNASASANFKKGVYRCLKPGCVGGLSVAQLKKLIREREEDVVDRASYDPFNTDSDNGTNSAVIDLDSRRAARAARSTDEDTVKELSEALVENYHRNLMTQPDLLEPFIAKRGLTKETIERFKVGYESKSKRYTIPVRDAEGRVVNFRKYRMNSEHSQKMSNHLGYGSPARLFPIAELVHDEVIVCEGEWDALALIQRGFHAVSGTHGSDTWLASWSPMFDGKHVIVLYDNDQAGRLGAKKVRHGLVKYAASLKIIEALCPGEGEDATDYFEKYEGTRRKLRKIIEEAIAVSIEDPSVADAEEIPVEVSSRVVDSMDSSMNGRAMKMTATITGAKGPTRSIPRDFLAHCTVEAGAKCKTCPMYQPHEGEFKSEIKTTDLIALSQFVEGGANDYNEIIRQHIGAAKCNFLTIDIHSRYTAEELFVAANVDTMNPNDADYTHRRVYSIGDNFDTKSNVVAHLTGSTWPSPKNSRNEFFCWDLKPAVTSLDRFEMTADQAEAMMIFRPEPGQPVLDKLRDIAVDRALSVTGILGRERMHMAMDLVFHSPLKYVWRGVESRGWLEMVLVGDTRTGKSAAARSLVNHYGLGHVISCEGATFAGLVGGNKQTQDQWMVQWGEYTLNDRRLVVMDEVSGLSQEIISLMSDIRSSGEAQLNKIEHGRTTARVRSIWISNPRVDKYVNEKMTLGIDIVQNVIGNPEDIARFDLAMSVREADVDATAINSVFHMGEPRYDQAAGQALILWVWSRRSDQIIFTDEAIESVYRNAIKLSEMYVLTPGLIQMGNAHEKVSRLAAAIAARVFSTDESRECIVVLPEHVKAACDFLHRLYSYDNFGYYSRSSRIIRNRKIAAQNVDSIKRWLMENHAVLEFLLDRKGSFRAQDLEEMAHLDRDEVRAVLKVLTDAKMVSKDKSQLIMEPELQELLKGFR